MSNDENTEQNNNENYKTLYAGIAYIILTILFACLGMPGWVVILCALGAIVCFISGIICLSKK